jgi:hypothetical protein
MGQVLSLLDLPNMQVHSYPCNPDNAGDPYSKCAPLSFVLLRLAQTHLLLAIFLKLI